MCEIIQTLSQETFVACGLCASLPSCRKPEAVARRLATQKANQKLLSGLNNKDTRLALKAVPFTKPTSPGSK